MRLTGVSSGARGFGPSDHLCWVYESLPDLHERMLEFLADGLIMGQRVCYTASGNAERLLEDLRGLDGLDEGLTSGAVQVRTLEEAYPHGRPVDVVAQVRAYTEQTEQACADGFTGLRVVTDATPLVRTADRLEAFLRYEHLADRSMAGRPFTAMCAFDRRELGPKLIAQIACMHPTDNDGAAQFRLYASDRAAATLCGEIDISSRDLLPLALVRADLWPSDGELVFDAAGLEFIDHHSLITLGKFAAGRGGVAVLRTATSGASRISEVLQLADVRVGPPL